MVLWLFIAIIGPMYCLGLQLLDVKFMSFNRDFFPCACLLGGPILVGGEVNIRMKDCHFFNRSKTYAQIGWTQGKFVHFLLAI